jgi:hypothetical protein
MPHTAALFRDTRAFDGTIFSRQQAMRFVGIELDWSAASQLA